jgi:hypothetical protein
MLGRVYWQILQVIFPKIRLKGLKVLFQCLPEGRQSLSQNFPEGRKSCAQNFSNDVKVLSQNFPEGR